MYTRHLGYSKQTLVKDEIKSQCFPIAEVHDSLTFDARDDKLVGALAERMCDPVFIKDLCPNFNCPLDVEISSGPYWK